MCESGSPYTNGRVRRRRLSAGLQRKHGGQLQNTPQGPRYLSQVGQNARGHLRPQEIRASTLNEEPEKVQHESIPGLRGDQDRPQPKYQSTRPIYEHQVKIGTTYRPANGPGRESKTRPRVPRRLDIGGDIHQVPHGVQYGSTPNANVRSTNLAPPPGDRGIL